MNLANPILICNSSDEFRSLLRTMLTKHGFFHLSEATREEEVLSYVANSHQNDFILIQEEMLSEDIITHLKKVDHYIIISQANSKKLMPLVLQLKMKNILNFPFSSQRLVERMISFS